MTLYRLGLHHPQGVTRVVVGAGALEAVGEELAAWVHGRTLFAVSTPRVLALHGGSLDAVRAAAGRAVTLEVEDGERAKSLATAERLWTEMLATGGKRDSRLLALGGGSCTDVAGFAAGCFLRGIDLVQVPTTLLGQVDAALGGKTAVDLPAAKNSVGLFHHPAFVVSDTRLLATLAPEEVRSGLVEVVKMAFLLEPELLGRIEDDLERLLAAEPEALAPVVAEGAAAKIAVVEADPAERGPRRLLNFGHTLGHAVEAALGYRGLRHGEAVAYGMLFALRLAARRGLSAPDADRLRALLGRLELPPLPALEAGELVAAMGRDKKARESGLVWILPARLGEGRAVEDVGEDEVRRELGTFLHDPWG